MVRFRDDVDGCGCLRCQEVDSDVLGRSGPGAFVWSSRLVLERPSVLLVFFAVAPLQSLVRVGSEAVVGASVALVILGVFLGRGYVDVTGRAEFADRHISSVEALRTVLRRLPALIGAIILVSVGLLVIALFVRVVLTPIAQSTLQPAGVDPDDVGLFSLVLIAVCVIYVLVKLCVLPEACFVGGYGPVASLRVSWTITSLQPTKAILVVSGFTALLLVGTLLDTHLVDPTSPVALSFRYRDTTVVLRSVGFSVASGVRFVFDVAVTAVYSGVFLHQYIDGVFQR